MIMKKPAFALALLLCLPLGAFAAVTRETERRDIVMGTNSSEIYHYYDTERDEKVWGIQAKPYVDNPPRTPGLIRPEINVPWPFPSGGDAPLPPILYPQAPDER